MAGVFCRDLPTCLLGCFVPMLGRVSGIAVTFVAEDYGVRQVASCTHACVGGCLA